MHVDPLRMRSEWHRSEKICMADGTPKILIVDDSSTMRRILRLTLTRCGYTDVTEAEDGQQALTLCETETFGCILTDWNMPNMDGLLFIKRVRTLPAYAQTPIIMVTTEGAANDVIEALTSGATSYIIKPFTPDILKQKMQEFWPA